jgi:hydrophobe/amphiphile efflux-3 (HAE3) family protein
VLALTALITAFAAIQVVDPRTGEPQLYLDPSINRLLPTADPAREFYDEVRLRFGSDEIVLIAIVDELGIFRPERLAGILEMTHRIEALPGVHHVVSLATALNIRAADGDMQIEPFLSSVPQDSAELERMSAEALANPVYAGNLVSPDARATALFVYLDDMPEHEFLALDLDRKMQAIAEQEAVGAGVWVTGGASIKAETGRALLDDLLRIVPLVCAIMGLIALLIFRSLRGVVVPLGTILISLVWTLGLVAPLMGSLNIVTIVVPPLILVVGFAYALHVLSDYNAKALHAGAEGEPRAVVLEALNEVALPVLLTGLTTGAGFLSLSVSNLPAIRQFAVASSIGVAATMVVSLSFAPALLAVMRLPRAAPQQGDEGEGRLDAFLEWLARVDLRHRVPILVCAGVVTLLSIYGMTRIQVSTDFASNFDRDSVVRRSFDAVNARLQGANPFYIVIRADSREAFLEPVNLAELQQLQQWLTEQPEIGGTTSLVDYVRLINRGFHDDEPEHLAIPKSRAMVSQLLLFGANDELENFVDSRYQTANVLVRSRAVDSEDIARLADRIEAHFAELPGHLEATVTGNTVLVARTIDDIAIGQALSLSTAFVIIYVILAILFTSLRVGFIALLPNALPVVVYFGTLGLTGVTLNVTTGLVACLVLGLAVDDTIHYLARFNAIAKRSADEEHGVIEALRQVGRPVTYTTTALCIGFLVLTTSNLNNLIEFGALASFTLLVAWVVDVTVTPALAAKLRIVSLWDVLTLDMGEDPHRAIGLFQGLSKTQARIAALATSIRNFSEGHRIITEGDEAKEMFVVIDGTLEASITGSDGPVKLRTHERGDVIGEVGLFHGTRTANVDALTDVRLVRLTPENLDRLRRRHPRIQAQILQNLSGILAERLASVTQRVT